MARRYTVTDNLQSLAASTTKVACQIATGSTINATVIAFDISFDSTASGSGAVPIRVQLARPTAAGSGGATFTPIKMYPADIAAATTARIHDTTAGSSPSVICEWLVSPTSGLSYQFPLGRELVLNNSDFLELKMISQSGMTTCNYSAQIYFEE